MTERITALANAPEEFLKSILDTAFYGIITFKAVRADSGRIMDFQCLFANDVAGEIAQQDPGEMTGGLLSKILPDYREIGLFSKYAEVVETGNSTTFEQDYPDGNDRLWFRVSVVRLGDGLTVTFQDITDLREAIMDVEMRERHYRKLFEESMDAIFLVDDELDFLDANSSLQQLFDYRIDGLRRDSMSKLFADENDFTGFREALVADGRTEEYEVVLQDRSGRKKYGLINSVAVLDEEHKTKTYLGVIRDMTKRKESDKRLLQAEKLSMTGKIARTIGHEIRNPLTNLFLALDQLKDEVPEEVEDADLYFNIIQRNADRISKLITDLMQSSKPKELKLVRSSLNEKIEAALELVSDRLKLQHMKLEVDFEDRLPDIPLDGDQIKVALLNLFVNAIEAMKPDVGILKVGTELIEGEIVVKVSDNGKGMTEEALGKLFEPFFTSKKEGTGLGLTTVQNIIHSHKGQIDAFSELGKGTTFRIGFRPEKL